MKEGDLITGVDRSYTRSIYKLIKKDPLELQFVSLGGYVPRKDLPPEIFKPQRNIVGYDTETSSLDRCVVEIKPIYGERITLGDYRLATEFEILASARFREITARTF